MEISQSEQSLIRPCFGLMELCGVSSAVLRPEWGLVLQRSTAREKGVLEVVVEETADGGHVDVCKARQSAREVSGVVVCSEQTPKLCIEDVLCLWPAIKTHSYLGTWLYQLQRSIVHFQTKSLSALPHGLSFSDPVLNNSLRW